ncbi:hypothetical protein [Bosea sp. 124]|uniref:hypothetical protein n=1 Tax=Bosea sp. 124 TaxID=2135642 RepID=UPI000D3C6D90|nr:hypothetical protein [Bosea sp. 124]PTM42694.1 hypothetical protein C8D03_4288 [Bosea sp. 124]
MPKRRNRFADLPPITDFASCQRVRPMLLHRVGDILEVWRGCDNSACTRARSCRRSDGACLTAFMQALPDEDRRLFRYALENRKAGLEPGEAFARAQARVEDEIARFGE